MVQTFPTNSDRARFFSEVERLLAPPVTKNGSSRVRPSRHYRSGSFVTGIGLSVDAQLGGRMGVELFSDDPAKHLALRRLGSEVKQGRLKGPSPELVSANRLGDKGKRLYFEFAWTRRASYSAELPRVETLIRWFVAIRNQVI